MAHVHPKNLGSDVDFGQKPNTSGLATFSIPVSIRYVVKNCNNKCDVIDIFREKKYE